MSANVNVLSLVRPASPAEALQSEREQVAAALVDASHKIARLGEAARAQDEIVAELEAIGRREDANVREWVAGGCEGVQPVPFDKERQKLNAKLAIAAEGARAAKAVIGEVETEAHGLRLRLAQVDDEIRTAKIARLESQFDDRHAEFGLLAEKMRSVLLEIRALPVALIGIGRPAFDRGEHAYGRTCFAMAEKMRNCPLPEIEPSDVDLSGAVARLSGRIVSGVDAPIAPTLSREALLAAAIAANQATTVVNKPDANS